VSHGKFSGLRAKGWKEGKGKKGKGRKTLLVIIIWPAFRTDPKFIKGFFIAFAIF